MKMHAVRRPSLRLPVGVLAAALSVSVVTLGVGTSGGVRGNSSLPPGAVVLKAPSLKGIYAIPGHGPAPAYTVSSSVGLLKLTPNQATAGTTVTVTGQGLAHAASVLLTWGTWNATWIADPEPNTANYMGRTSTAVDVVLGHVTTNSNGAFSYKFVVPHDFGGIHEINAVIGGVSQAYGGLVLRRTVTISPTSGPIGTPITITYSGLGSSLYSLGGSVLWDNHFAGEMTANWTRGTATAVIPAAGPVGTHYIQVGDGIGILYMNIQQSPLPYATGRTVAFRTTSDPGPRAAAIYWPQQVVPTVSARTTLLSGVSGSATEGLSTTQGTVGSRVTVKATGISSNAAVQMYFVTVVGNRVNCTGVCWANVSVPLGTATVSNGAVHANVHIPDGLGGWHIIELAQGSTAIAQEPFYVKASVVGHGVSALVVKQGSHFTMHFKGIGWTQFDNTMAVDYDNSFVGYGCGFNSNGDMVVNLIATGGPGTHIIDLYPQLYTNQPSFPNSQFGMLPFLTYAKDFPGLALGYHVPAIRLAVTVVP